MNPGFAGAISGTQILRQRSRREAGLHIRAKKRTANPRDLGYFPAHRFATLSMIALRDWPHFHTAVVLAILLTGILVGVNTYHLSSHSALVTLALLDEVVMGVFLCEVTVKMLAEGTAPWLFFKSGWNVFDTAIVLVGLLPVSRQALTALRLVRLLRVLKLVRALKELRILILSLFKSLTSIAYIALLLFLLYYMFAVVGVILFGDNDPLHFGNLHNGMVTLFRVSTLDDWTDVAYIQIYGCDEFGYGISEDQCTKPEKFPIIAPPFFVIFVLLSSMMVINLFIGVIMASMHDAKLDVSSDDKEGLAAKKAGVPTQTPILERLRTLRVLMDEICDDLERFTQLQAQHVAGKMAASTPSGNQLQSMAKLDEEEEEEEDEEEDGAVAASVNTTTSDRQLQYMPTSASHMQLAVQEAQRALEQLQREHGATCELSDVNRAQSDVSEDKRSE